MEYVTEIEQEEEIDCIANQDRRVVDMLSKIVNLGHKRCTEMKSNRRIIFPTGRPPKEEAVMNVRYQMWMDSVRRYREKETEDGVQRSEQLDNKLGARTLGARSRGSKNVTYIQ